MKPVTHLQPLDALRGFAVLVVILSHAANDGLLPHWLGDGAGQMGVQLFFLLSGYLMWHCYGDLKPENDNIRKFILGRVARILPLFWLVLLVSVLLSQLGINTHYKFDSAAQFAGAFLFLVAPYELWSVPVEVQFYSVFVLLWLAGARFSQNSFWFLAGAFALAIFWRGWISEADILLPYIPFFLIGVLIRLRQNQLARVITMLGNPFATFLCLIFFALNLPGIRGGSGLEIVDGFYPRLWLDPLRLMAICLLFLSALSERKNHWNLPSGLAFLGQISFCVYLIHRPILKYLISFEFDIAGPVIALICLVLCIPIAWGSLIWFERPVQRAIKSSRVWTQRQAPQATAG